MSFILIRLFDGIKSLIINLLRCILVRKMKRMYDKICRAKKALRFIRSIVVDVFIYRGGDRKF